MNKINNCRLEIITQRKKKLMELMELSSNPRTTTYLKVAYWR